MVGVFPSGGQSRGVAHGALPRGGVRHGVLPLWVLLPGVGVLRGISAAWKAGSITGTANGPTARGAASGA